MVTIDFQRAGNMRVYKDGVYLRTLTAVSTDLTQETVDRLYIGETEATTIPTVKTFSGSLTRDLQDEQWLETILGRTVTTKFTATNYDDLSDTVQDTVDNTTAVDYSFTTPNEDGLMVEKVSLNLKKVGDFTGGILIEVWQGLAGSGTLKATFSLDNGDMPTIRNEYLDALLNPESAEVALVKNVAHTLRIKDNGTPTGSVQLYGPSAATTGYYAITYEMAGVEASDYFLDMTIASPDNTETIVVRFTGVTFLSDGLTINPSEPISEATSFKASAVTII